MRIYLDAMVWIYHFESPTQLGDQARSVIQHARVRKDTILTSHHVLAETLVVPTRQKSDFLISSYRRALLYSDAVTVVPFGSEAASRFAEIRATTTAHPLDSIHLALAASASCDLFVTGDTRIQKLAVPGIGQIVGLDVKLP